MKKLWITVIALSTFHWAGVSADSLGQEAVINNRGAGRCWTAVKGPRGKDQYVFNASSDERCGWFNGQSISRDIAGSDVGWPAAFYIKVVNVANPKKVWYFGGGPFELSHAVQFGKGAKIACYGCLPKSGIYSNLPINCSPNDADRVKHDACFKGTDALDCSQEVDCSKVLDITECYPRNEGVIAASYPDDLGLCGQANRGLNLGVGAGSAMTTPEATTQAYTGVGARAALTA